MATLVSVAMGIVNPDDSITHLRVAVDETVHSVDGELDTLILEAGAALERMTDEALTKAKQKVKQLVEQQMTPGDEPSG